MRPGTLSIGFSSPRQRDGTRASTTTSSSPRSRISSAPIVSPLRSRGTKVVGSTSSSPARSAPPQLSIPPSSTAHSAWPKWRSSHQSRSAPPMFPYATTKTPSSIPAREAAAANARGPGSGCRPAPFTERSERSASTSRNDRAGDVARSVERAPPPRVGEVPTAVDESVRHARTVEQVTRSAAGGVEPTMKPLRILIAAALVLAAAALAGVGQTRAGTRPGGRAAPTARSPQPAWARSRPCPTGRTSRSASRRSRAPRARRSRPRTPQLTRVVAALRVGGRRPGRHPDRADLALAAHLGGRRGDRRVHRGQLRLGPGAEPRPGRPRGRRGGRCRREPGVRPVADPFRPGSGLPRRAQGRLRGRAREGAGARRGGRRHARRDDLDGRGRRQACRCPSPRVGPRTPRRRSSRGRRRSRRRSASRSRSRNGLGAVWREE